MVLCIFASLLSEDRLDCLACLPNCMHAQALSPSSFSFDTDTHKPLVWLSCISIQTPTHTRLLRFDTKHSCWIWWGYEAQNSCQMTATKWRRNKLDTLVPWNFANRDLHRFTTSTRLQSQNRNTHTAHKVVSSFGKSFAKAASVKRPDTFSVSHTHCQGRDGEERNRRVK